MEAGLYILRSSSAVIIQTTKRLQCHTIKLKNMAENNEGSSATTILVTVVIILIIGIAFYFGFVRGGVVGNNAPNDVNVDLNVPTPGGGQAQ